MSQQPSVGRVVHFHGHEHPLSQDVAAIITEVDPQLCNDQWYEMSGIGEDYADRSMVVRLKILWPEREEPIGSANLGHLYPFSEEPKLGHWSWPSRV
ncbi:hypothetical protein ACLRGI_05050 [Paenarthrobacter nitroguajacolicus]|uniref:hypothetical protein n=1 Tax=Paenarthrobacter nitroguajacolicus TaxID=211146 RepID=UPI003AD9C045